MEERVKEKEKLAYLSGSLVKFVMARRRTTSCISASLHPLNIRIENMCHGFPRRSEQIYVYGGFPMSCCAYPTRSNVPLAVGFTY